MKCRKKVLKMGYVVAANLLSELRQHKTDFRTAVLLCNHAD